MIKKIVDVLVSTIMIEIVTEIGKKIAVIAAPRSTTEVKDGEEIRGAIALVANVITMRYQRLFLVSK